MKRVGDFMLRALSIFAAVFGIVGVINFSLAGGAVFLVAALLLWPSVGDKVAKSTGKKWLSPVLGVVCFLLVGPIVAAINAPSNEELTARSAQKTVQAQAEDAEKARKSAERAKEKAAAEASKAQEKRQRECSDTTMAFVMSQNFVKRSLKAPSTAKFPYINDSEVSVAQAGECKFKVYGYVDAQNGFGAMMRTPYTIEMQYYPETQKWGGTNLSM